MLYISIDHSQMLEESRSQSRGRPPLKKSLYVRPWPLPPTQVPKPKISLVP
jgi:hypothetical protein